MLSKLITGISASVAAPILGKAQSFDSISDMEKSPILKMRALGFQWETLDPFLFCAHHDDHFPKGNSSLGPAASLAGRNIGQDFLLKDGWRMYHGETIPGFPHHPHRGFETITVVRKGMVDHADSMGAAGRYGNGDVQWMTAGGGVNHSEMFPLLRTEGENHLELFQIWLNLPAKNKMVKPHFKMLWADQIPNLNLTDASGKKINIEVIAGPINGQTPPTPPPNSWANNASNHVAVWNINLDPGAEWLLPAAVPGLNRTLYFYEGTGLSIAGQTLKPYHAVDLESSTSVAIKAGADRVKILVLQGKPIGEPVVQHGPFVMNTRDEIRQTFEDYQRTGFGGWPWPRKDMVHGSSRGRFARHADGKEEQRG